MKYSGKVSVQRHLSSKWPKHTDNNVDMGRRLFPFGKDLTWIWEPHCRATVEFVPVLLESACF